MAELGEDQLTDMLNDGWTIAGYSVNMMALGALAHNLLLQKDNHLTSITVITQGDSETGRNVNVLSPKPEGKKKGFLG